MAAGGRMLRRAAGADRLLLSQSAEQQAALRFAQTGFSKHCSNVPAGASLPALAAGQRTQVRCSWIAAVVTWLNQSLMQDCVSVVHTQHDDASCKIHSCASVSRAGTTSTKTLM